MAKKRQEDPPKGLAPWMATFSDLMNLLLCFFVLLFSMSTVDAEKFEQLAASLNSSFSILPAGATAIGDGILISAGVSQLNELDDYISSMGRNAEQEETDKLDEVRQEQLKESERMQEQIEEMLNSSHLADEIEVDFTAQYVSLTLNGAILFDSGSAQVKETSYPIMDKIGAILMKFSNNLIEIEGHTDNVPIHNARFSDNDELSNARALEVFRYLIKTTELDAANVKHAGRGEYVPIADNSTPEGRMKNRRVEIKIYNSLSDIN